MKLSIGKCTKQPWEYDRYYCDGNLYDDNIPKGYHLRGEAYINGSELVGVCYNVKKRILIIILIILLVGVLGMTLYTLASRYRIMPVDEDRVVDTGTTNDTQKDLFGEALVIRYNKFPANINGSLDVRLVNGYAPATITIEAKGVSMDAIELKANEERYYALVNIDNPDEIINGQLVYTSGETVKRFDIAIENLADDSLNVPDEYTTFEDEEVLQ